MEQILNFIKSNPQMQELPLEIIESIRTLSLNDKHLLLAKSAELGAIAFFQLLLNDPDINLNHQDKLGNTALIYAVKGKNEIIISQLLKKNVEIGLANSIGDTALHIAIGYQETNILEKLLDACPIQMHFEEPLLIAAIKMNSVKVVEFLLTRNFDPNVQDNMGNTPLHHAVYSFQKNILIPLLIKAKASINNANHKGETPFFAIVRNFPNLIEDFIKMQADYSLTDKKGRNLLMYAAECGDIDPVSTLLSLDFDINQQDLNGETALFYAVRNGHKEIASLFLQQGANIEHRNNNNKTVLLVADSKMKDFLVREGADSSEISTKKIINETLPEFKYYSSDELRRNLITTFGPCDCCKKKRGVLFKNTYVIDFNKYTKDDIDDDANVCPWCIASGAFYKKFKTFPLRTQLNINSKINLTKTEIQDFYRLTPDLETLQEISWPVHCQLPSKFLGTVGWDEISTISRPIEIEGWGLLDSSPEQEWLKDLDREGSPRGYLFECQTCHKLLLIQDAD